MSRILSGLPAAPGVAVAATWHYRPDDGRRVGAIDHLGLDAAAEAAAQQLAALARRLDAAGRAAEGEILAAQELLAHDEELLGGARRRIAAGSDPAAAMIDAGAEAAAVLAALDDEVLASRAADVRDVAARIARALRGAEQPMLTERSIVVADDLPPSVTAELDAALLAGIVLERGSPAAHAAILARALGIPAAVAVSGAMAATREGETLALDGDAGVVIGDPTADEMAALAARVARAGTSTVAPASLSGAPLETADHHRLVLGANIGAVADAQRAVEAGAEAVGLFRTEFLFMGRRSPPDEATQADAYGEVLRTFGARPVTIRLLDVGGDKALPYLELAEEANPFLGVRAIRLAAHDRQLLVTQLRAILRAGRDVGRAAEVMAPMVADLADVALLRDLLGEATAGIPDAPVPRLGIMVEVPSAVTVADQLAARVEFFSIGTNDLTQYLLAADRTNAALAARQDPLHPAVVRSVAAVVAAGRHAGIAVAVCGEAAGDPVAAIVLAGLGVDELSMDLRAFDAVKRALRAVTLGEAEQVAAAAAAAATAAETRASIIARLADRGAA